VDKERLKFLSVRVKMGNTAIIAPQREHSMGSRQAWATYEDRPLPSLTRAVFFKS
jgi:hypothetical protein